MSLRSDAMISMAQNHYFVIGDIIIWGVRLSAGFGDFVKSTPPRFDKTAFEENKCKLGIKRLGRVLSKEFFFGIERSGKHACIPNINFISVNTNLNRMAT